MTKYLFYRMTHDSGFAPNPFWGYLTLSACTPNHSDQAKGLKIGDWIIGVEAKSLAEQRRKKGLNPNVEQSLIYVAKIDEILNLNEYFQDKRFEKKKFRKSYDYKEGRGDNIYYIEDGKWKWLRGHNHEPNDLCNLPDEEVFFKVEDLENLLKNEEVKRKYGEILKDLKGNRVYISKDFLYFGDKGVEFDKRFLECLHPNQGIKYCPKNLINLLKEYIDKLIEKYGYGVHGNPINYSIKNKCGQKDESCF